MNTDVRNDVSPTPLTVLCLCAQWCGTCREYRAEFDNAAKGLANVRCAWVDIEDDEALLGDDLDIQTFPTMLIARRGQVLFFGALLPQISVLRRLLLQLETAQDGEPVTPRADSPQMLQFAQELLMRWNLTRPHTTAE